MMNQYALHLYPRQPFFLQRPHYKDKPVRAEERAKHASRGVEWSAGFYNTNISPPILAKFNFLRLETRASHAPRRERVYLCSVGAEVRRVSIKCLNITLKYY